MPWSSRLRSRPPAIPETTQRIVASTLDSSTLPVFKKHYAMGAVFEILTYRTDPAQASTAMDRAFQEIDRLEGLMSIYRPESELSRLNRFAHRQAQSASPDLYQVIEQSLYYSDLSDGAFDVTAGPLAERWKAVGRGEPPPTAAEEQFLRRSIGYRQVELIPPDGIRFHCSCLAIDLGAIGKGYAVDRAASVLRSFGVECALVNAGGSTFYGMGSPPDQAGWRVYLCDPSSQFAPHVLLHQSSVSTSQQTRPSLLGLPSFGHVIDTVAGEPLKSATAVSVVTQSATASDALSTALLVMGPKKGRELVKRVENMAAAWMSSEEAPQIATNGTEILINSAARTSTQTTVREI